MSKDPHIAHIFSAEDETCLSLEQMTAYQEARLEGHDRHLVERHLINCGLCAITFETLSETGAAHIATGAEEVAKLAWERVQAKETRRRRGAIFWIASAASIALLITAGYLSFRSPTNAEIENSLAEAMNVTPPLPTDLRSLDTIALAKNPEMEERQYADRGDRDLLSDEASMEHWKERPESPSSAEISPSRQQSVDNVGGGNVFSDAYPSKGGNVPRSTVLESRPTQKSSSNVADVGLDQPPKTPANESSVSSTMLMTAPSLDQQSGVDGSEAVTASKAEKKAMPARRAQGGVGGVDGLEKDDFRREGGLGLKGERSEGEMSAKEGVVKGNGHNDLPKAKQGNRSEAPSSKGKGAVALGSLAVKRDDPAPPSPVPLAAPPVDFYSDGLADYKSGNYREAAGKLRKAAETTPDNLQAHLYAADSYLRIAQPSAALFHIDRILSVPGGEGYEDAEWYKALALLQLKEGKKAERQLEAVIARNGKYKSRAEAALTELK